MNDIFLSVLANFIGKPFSFYSKLIDLNNEQNNP